MLALAEGVEMLLSAHNSKQCEVAAENLKAAVYNFKSN